MVLKWSSSSTSRILAIVNSFSFLIFYQPASSISRTFRVKAAGAKWLLNKIHTLIQNTMLNYRILGVAGHVENEHLRPESF